MVRKYGRSKGTKNKTAGPSKSTESAGVTWIRHVAEAEVTGVELHPKQPGMYRVAIRLYGENDSDPSADPVDSPASETPGDWNDQVDALIAGAAQASIAGAGETVLTVHEDTLVSLRLLRGRRLSGTEWEALRLEESREEAYRAALYILERKARTSRELSEALKRKGFTPDVIGSCLERLQSRRMLDDTSYARRFAEQRATGQRKGSRLIRQELMQRGITKEDADHALGELDANVELEAAIALARKKWPQLKGELRDRKMKLTGFLLRRGYPNGMVREAIQVAAEDALRTEEPDEGWDFDAGDWDVPGHDDAEGLE